jgi:hypothetical protein
MAGNFPSPKVDHRIARYHTCAGRSCGGVGMNLERS